MTIDYYKMFSTLVQRWSDLTRKRDEIDAEIAKINQLVLATFPLIPEEKQRLFQKDIEAMEEETAGLLDAIKLIFSAHKGEWLTVSGVRDYLLQGGFDFRHYRANPLASIGTTLKRMVPAHLESRTSPGGTVYKKHVTIGDRIGQRTVPPVPGSPGVTLPTQDDLAREGDKLWEGYPDPLNQRGKKK